nr:response regulator [Rhizobium cauense]
MVVEDEPVVMMMTVSVVEDAGFEALGAENADAAIAILESVDGIRIVMTDIDMAGSMNGLQLAAIVRKRWPLIKIVVVSGKQHPAANELPTGGVFVAKPYNPRTMADMLMRMSE